MKKVIAVLIALACVFIAPMTVWAANDAITQESQAPATTDDISETDCLTEDAAADSSPAATSVPIVEDTDKLESEEIVEDTDKLESEENDMPDLADGQAGRGSIEAPDKYWAENGYPDDISFAYEAGGELLEDGTNVSWWEIGIVNADDNRKKEILDMISPSCIITFVECRYSYHQREAAYNEIRASTDENIHDAVMVLNSEVVLVEISEDHMKEYAAKFIQQYGSFVVVTNDLDAAQNDVTLGGGLDKGPEQADSALWLWAIVAAAFIGGATLLFLNRARLIPAMQTTRGAVVANPVSRNRKQTVAAIRDNEYAPSDQVFTSILGKIDKRD